MKALGMLTALLLTRLAMALVVTFAVVLFPFRLAYERLTGES